MLVRKLLHLRNKTKNDHTAQAVEDDFDNTECDTEGFFFLFLLIEFISLHLLVLIFLVFRFGRSLCMAEGIQI